MYVYIHIHISTHQTDRQPSQKGPCRHGSEMPEDVICRQIMHSYSGRCNFITRVSVSASGGFSSALASCPLVCAAHPEFEWLAPCPVPSAAPSVCVCVCV